MQSDACGTSDIADYQCLGMDGMLMSEACLNSAAPILSLESTDIAASVSAWTTVHQACVAITDAVRRLSRHIGSYHFAVAPVYMYVMAARSQSSRRNATVEQ